jgi:Rap1a immunity proteins
MMKALAFALLLSTSASLLAGTGVITDGQSLADGLELYERSQAGTSVTWPEAAKATMSASYAQAFASACVVWQTKFPHEAPFRLPSGLTPEQFVKIAHKYLKDHPDRLKERAEFLLYDAAVAAFPRK